MCDFAVYDDEGKTRDFEKIHVLQDGGLMMKAYKGTDKNLQCKGLQYELGKETVHKGEVVPCKEGWHACKNPLDVLAYYIPADGARYFEVDCDGDIKHHNDDSKIACQKITLKTEIGLLGLVKAGVEMIFARVKNTKPNQYTSGDWSTAATSGNQSTAATSGYQSTAATSGDWSTAATSGDQSTAVANGEESLAVANGWKAMAKGSLGCYLVLTEYSNDGNLLDVKAQKVDGEKIKADTLYMLIDGEFREANDE